MLLTSLFLLTLAAALLALYPRGYVVARGRFCRACRFDLAGLADASACPECGSDLSAPRAVSPVLLRRHRAILAAGVLLLLCGVTTLGYLGFTNRNSILPHLPNRILIPLESAGYSEARTVIAMRAQNPEAFTDAQWQTLLTRALAHQADTTAAWDTRWGDVLGRAFINRLMTEEQMRAYLDAGLTVSVQIRDRATLDQHWFGYTVRFGYGRIHLTRPFIGTGNPWGLQTPFDASQMSRSGLVGLYEPRGARGSGTRGEFYIPWGTGGPWGGISGSVPLRGFDRKNPPSEVVAFVEVPLVLTDRATGEEVLVIAPRRTEQTVRLLPPGTPIVTTVTDDAAAADIRDGVRLTGMTIDPTEEAVAAGSAVRVDLSIPAAPHAIAGYLFAVSPDGHETELGSISLPAGTSTRYSLGTAMRPDAAGQLDRFRGWLQAGKIDLVFRTDPEAARNNPAIDTVVDLTLRFRDVPVVPSSGGYPRSAGDPEHRPEGATPEPEAPAPTP